MCRFGFDIDPPDVEATLNAHPAVARSAVRSRVVEGIEENEEIFAFVQLLPSSLLTATDLAGHAARHLAPYKRPSRILLTPALPLTPTGKVAKAELAKMAI